MMIKNPTPHEVEAHRVAAELRSLGCWASAGILEARVRDVGLNDDRDLREALASICRGPEQIGASIRKVHDAIAASGAGAEAM